MVLYTSQSQSRLLVMVTHWLCTLDNGAFRYLHSGTGRALPTLHTLVVIQFLSCTLLYLLRLCGKVRKRKRKKKICLAIRVGMPCVPKEPLLSQARKGMSCPSLDRCRFWRKGFRSLEESWNRPNTVQTSILLRQKGH